MSTIVAEETNYQKMTAQKPSYQLFRVSQQSGGTSITLSNAGGEQSVFEIPANVLNFSRSILSFDETAAAQDGVFGSLFLGGSVPSIRDLEVYTQNGVRLCNIPNANKYLQVVRKTDTKIEDFLCSDENGLEKINIIGAVDRNYRFPVADNGNPVLTAARIPHIATEPQYTGVVDYVTSGAVNTAFGAQFRLDLSEIKNTILELDKDLYFRGEIIYLRITWAPLSQIGSAGDDVTLSTQIPLVAATITNLYLYLAVEKNEILANQVKEQVMGKGLTVLIDYVHAHNQNLTGTSHSLSQRFSRAHGRTLKKVYTIPYIGSSTTLSNYYNHHYNQANEAVLSLYTMLNNERLQQWNMDTVSGDEYMVMKDVLKGSVIQTSDQFLSYYFFVDVFDNLKLHEREPNVVSGIPLEQEQKYDVLATAEATRNYYQYAVCQRMLSISGSDGIIID